MTMLQKIRSRLTMKYAHCAFIDKVSGREVFHATDCYGNQWLAEYGLFGFRVLKEVEDDN